MTTRRYGEMYVGYRDYAQSTSSNSKECLSEIGTGLGDWIEPTVFNLNETSCMEDEEGKGDRTQCCNPYLEPCRRCGIYGMRQHYELRTFAKAGTSLEYFGAYFCGAGDASLFETHADPG
jgi:hypothetical protein